MVSSTSRIKSWFLFVSIFLSDEPSVTDGGSVPPSKPPTTSVYEAVGKLSLKESRSDPCERRPRAATASSRVTKIGKLGIRTLPESTCLGEISQFRDAVVRLRASHPSNDVKTNPGYVVSPVMEFLSADAASLSVKILVYSLAKPGHPVAFTSDLTATVDHVIAQAVCELSDAQGLVGDPSDFVFKVRNKGEYVDRRRHLFEIEYVHRCVKFDTDVEFQLFPATRIAKTFIRTSVDDVRDAELDTGAIIPPGFGDGIPHANLSVIFDVLNAEFEKLEKAAAICVSGSDLTPRPCVQATKALCSLLLEVETPEITKAVRCLTSAAHQGRDSTASPHALINTGIRDLQSAFRSVSYFRCISSFSVYAIQNINKHLQESSVTDK